MADPAIVGEWLEKANEDFLFAEANLREGNGFFAQICFHFQQAAEKYLKAYIIAKGLRLEKVHDLLHLLRTCMANDTAFSALQEQCILLNAAYIETRYPVHWPIDYTREMGEQAHSAAADIAGLVRERIAR